MLCVYLTLSVRKLHDLVTVLLGANHRAVGEDALFEARRKEVFDCLIRKHNFSCTIRVVLFYLLTENHEEKSSEEFKIEK